MLRLWKIKAKHQLQSQKSNGANKIITPTAAGLRLTKDMNDLKLPASSTISFPNGIDDIMNFEISLKPEEGPYSGGIYVFSFLVTSRYPYQSPIVKCKTKVGHPNIDVEGNVCLSILGDGWYPVLDINTIVNGRWHLLIPSKFGFPARIFSETVCVLFAYSLMRKNTLCSQQLKFFNLGEVLFSNS